MKRGIRYLLAIGLSGFLGCSSGTEILKYATFPKITDDDFSTVYLFRESNLYGSAKAAPIQVNGLQFFRIGDGDCVSFRIPTGQSEMVFVPEWKQIRFVSEKGKKYYFFLRVKPGKADADFRQLKEEEWNEKQKACNWVELKQGK